LYAIASGKKLTLFCVEYNRDEFYQ